MGGSRGARAGLGCVLLSFFALSDADATTAVRVEGLKGGAGPKMQPMSIELLQEQLKAEEGGPCVALDIDETLAWTGKYWMESMQSLFGNPEGLTPEDMFAKYKMCQNVPYWNSNRKAREWMHQRRSCEETQKHLPTMPGAAPGVQSLLDRGVRVAAYLTVRPEELAQGTAEWLHSKGFPRAPVVAKPKHVIFEDGSHWKARALDSLWPRVMGLVDDSPSVLRSCADVGYKGVFFLFGHTEEDARRILETAPWRDPKDSAAQESQSVDGQPRNGAQKGHESRLSVVVCPSWEDAPEKIGGALTPDQL